MNPSRVAEIVSQLKMKNANLINIIQEKDNLIVALNKKITEKENVIQEKENVIQEKENVIQEKENVIQEKDNLIQEKDNDKEVKEILNKLDSQNTKYTYTGNFIIYE